MITIAICEDEAFFAAELNGLLCAYPGAEQLAPSIPVFSDGEQLLASGQPPDVVLMDVKLPGRDGMQTVRRLRERGWGGQVIFITAYRQYVFQAFDLDAVHYILKPVTAEKLYSALDKAVKRAVSRRGRTILLPGGDGLAKIPMGDILYCEALDHQITVHTAAGRFRFFGTLDAMQGQLDGRFFRCHRSYLVNMDQVVGQKPGLAVVAGGDEILIARRKRQAFTRRLLDVCGEGMV